MNERIKELAEQANLKLDDLPDEVFIPLEEFAELIVRECVYLAKNHVMNISTYSDAYFVEKQIREHFGIEESE